MRERFIHPITTIVFVVAVTALAVPQRALAAPFPGTLSWGLRTTIPHAVSGAAGGVIGDHL